MYSFLQAPHQNPTTNVASILKHYTVSNETSSLLSQSDSAKILSSLSHQADNLFSDSADRLSLPPLCQFIKSLCRASRDQLYRSSSLKRGSKVWWPTRSRKQKNDSLPLSLLLHRVGDVTLRVFRSSRPLLHIFKMFAIAGPHLMDVSCNRLKVCNCYGHTVNDFCFAVGCLSSRSNHIKTGYRIHSRYHYRFAGGTIGASSFSL